MYLRKILGDALITELQTQIKAAQTTPPPADNPITPDNRALLIQIAPALAYYGVYQGLPFQWAKIQNKGLTAEKSENSDALAYSDVAKLQTKTFQDAEALARNLIEYLCSCAAKYPKWSPAPGYGCIDHNFDYVHTPGCECEMCRSRRPVPYFAGIHIPKHRCR